MVENGYCHGLDKWSMFAIEMLFLTFMVFNCKLYISIAQKEIC
jgi:hypothetical protein